jgi:hypothetical protein
LDMSGIIASMGYSVVVGLASYFFMLVILPGGLQLLRDLASYRSLLMSKV